VRRALLALPLVFAAALVAHCASSQEESPAPLSDDGGGDASAVDGAGAPTPGGDGAAAPPGTPSPPPVGVDAAVATFDLVPEWSGPCHAATGAINVNLGNAPEAFVRAAYCQINGTDAPAATVSDWANQLRTSYVRRVDVVRALCQQANNACTLEYSSPWKTDPPLVAPCTRKTTRDVGAVMMFFFTCPGATNCAMDWANTHAYGMRAPDPIYGTADAASGYYAPDNEGFWIRELLDARYAGLQLVLPNVYGFDIQAGQAAIPNLEAALSAIDAMGGGGMKVGLFNDTWAWGEAAGGTLMNPAPDLSNTEDAAQRIYAVEWKPFFSGVTKSHWYTVNGAPLIVFYNAGTLKPATGASAVIARMKQLFQADFGVTPFVDVDRGYGATASSDAQFVWDTFTNDADAGYMNLEKTATGGLAIVNTMVKWDSLGRDDPGAIATAATRLFKGTDILTNVLAASTEANLLLLETWNDLGEGTGITRNYDYYVKGAWLPPNAFMKIIRNAQCSN
jgi:hypothetical protein